MVINPAFSRGFSLLELAIVLFIVALLLGGLLVPLAFKETQSDIRETRDQLEEIRQALLGFVYLNGYFPCPDTDGDGEEDRTGSDCDVSPSPPIGGLPWVTLAVREQDAWGNRFTYRVTGGYSDTTDGTGCTPYTPGVSIALCSEGDINIKDSSPGGNNVATEVPAVVVSHGANFNDPTGAESADEEQNKIGGSDPALFIARDYSQAPGSGFDDIIIWISPNVLRAKMVSAGILP